MAEGRKTDGRRPDWHHVVRARLTDLRLTASAESDLTEELAQHLEDLHSELCGGGASDDEAYARTVSELDDMCALRNGLHRDQLMAKHEPVPIGDARSGTQLDDVRRDLRYAGRIMRANPMFVLVVVVTLGLGIGANAAVFAVINTLILNPLPATAPSELVAVAAVAGGAAAESNTLMPLSIPNLRDYQTRNGVFRSLAGYARMRALTWQTNGAAQGLLTEFVTGNYFPTIGVAAARGRTFGLEADSSGSAHAVVVMNYGTWQTRFGGAPDIVGRQLRLNDVVVTVVGVTRPGFTGVNGLVGPELWAPVALAEQLLPNDMRTAQSDRSQPLLQGVARIRPGVTVAQAQANVAVLAAALAREYPATNEDQAVAVRPIGDVLFGGGSTLMRLAFAVLAMVTAVVLLIACLNVANLQLARSATRQQEMAVRVALGASRARLVRQLLTESASLGLLSGGLGLLVAWAGMQLLAKTLPASSSFVNSRLDGAVLLFTLVVSLATSVIFGIIPALRVSRTSVAGVLREARSAGQRARRVSVANALIVGQVALSFLLLVMAALFVRSMQRAYLLDPGFKAERLAIFITNPGQAGYGAAQITSFYREVRERVARLPDVASVSWASNMPLFARPVGGLRVEGRPLRSSADAGTTIVNTVDRGYFDSAGVVIERGRAFTELDGPRALAVAIVNEKLAHDYWPGEDAVGKRIQAPGEREMRQIVGVARIANYSTFGEPPQRCLYLPLAQNQLASMTLYVRSKGSPAQTVRAVEREISAAGPRVLVSGIRTGQQVIDGGLFQARIGVTLLSMFGLLALGLASIGLYGSLAYAVSQRHREIGLRMALGASRQGVVLLIVRQGMSLVGLGVAIGVAAAFPAGRLVSRMLYGVGASDPISLAGAVLVLCAVALAACYLPARRAARVDLLVALRQV